MEHFQRLYLRNNAISSVSFSFYIMYLYIIYTLYILYNYVLYVIDQYGEINCLHNVCLYAGLFNPASDNLIISPQYRLLPLDHLDTIFGYCLLI